MSVRRGVYLRMIKQQIRSGAAVFGDAGHDRGVDMSVIWRSRRTGSDRVMSALVPGALGAPSSCQRFGKDLRARYAG